MKCIREHLKNDHFDVFKNQEDLGESVTLGLNLPK